MRYQLFRATNNNGDALIGAFINETDAIRSLMAFRGRAKISFCGYYIIDTETNEKTLIDYTDKGIELTEEQTGGDPFEDDRAEAEIQY